MVLHSVSLGWLTLLPAVATVFLAFATRQVLLALFIGICTGGVVLALQTGQLADVNIVTRFLLPAIGSETYAVILLIYLWCLGGLIGLWHKTGAARHFADSIGRKIVKGPRTAMLFAWFMGMVFHQGGTVSTVLTGTTVKPVTDANNISHEELSYIVDSTASPIATLIPFNAWPIYVSGLILGSIPLLSDKYDAFDMYLKALPYNFYAIFAVFFTGLFSAELLPWIGKSLKAARVRSRQTGKLDADGAEPLMKVEGAHANRAHGYKPSVWDFLLPIMVLLSIAIIPYVLGAMHIIPKMYSNWVSEAFFMAVLTGMVLAKLRGMALKDVLDGFVEGCQGVTIGAIVLGMAVTLGYVTKQIHMADFIIDLVDQSMPHYLLPGLLTFLCLVIAFATGSSWGTFAVVLPVALPLAYAFNPDPTYVQICLGAVLGGAVAGDQCSPISDTTVLASMTTGCDLLDHVKTQLPLAMVTIVIAIGVSTATTLYLF